MHPQRPIDNTEMEKGRKKEIDTQKRKRKLGKPNDKNQTNINEMEGRRMQGHTHSVRERRRVVGCCVEDSGANSEGSVFSEEANETGNENEEATAVFIFSQAPVQIQTGVTVAVPSEAAGGSCWSRSWGDAFSSKTRVLSSVEKKKQQTWYISIYAVTTHINLL